MLTRKIIEIGEREDKRKLKTTPLYFKLEYFFLIENYFWGKSKMCMLRDK